jgi:hypothetical protein
MFPGFEDRLFVALEEELKRRNLNRFLLRTPRHNEFTSLDYSYNGAAAMASVDGYTTWISRKGTMLALLMGPNII